MSRHDDMTRLQQTLDYARETLQLSQGRTRSDLESDRMFDLAMTRLLEIIGEAASKVSPLLQTTHQDVEWGRIVGLRNRLIHGYDSIDRDIVWEIVEGDVPALVVRLEQIIQALGGTSPSSST